ncbi:MAG: hypothetical protein FRX48_07251 [Lasallia pustulata]|uniref:Uncharacterized protein n=1 Tax=Lasallia pustulata TaxID=136370 RepID=A0A5M8PHN7_9LECA|nr:MAG: hypothetical protein FRX48_07251 [Lasallia pustulata]
MDAESRHFAVDEDFNPIGTDPHLLAMTASQELPFTIGPNLLAVDEGVNPIANDRLLHTTNPSQQRAIPGLPPRNTWELSYMPLASSILALRDSSSVFQAAMPRSNTIWAPIDISSSSYAPRPRNSLPVLDARRLFNAGAC